jgi:hypothetical protein
MALNPALVSLFNNFVTATGGLYVARLYTITLAGGGIIRFTDADCDIVGVSTWPFVNGYRYASGGVRVDQRQSKTQAHFKVGLDTDTWTLVLMPRPFDAVTGAAFPDTIGTVPWIQAAQAGSLDWADFQVDEAYFSSVPTWPMPPGGAVPVGCKTIFAGLIAEVDTTNAMVVLTVNDERSLLDISMPLHFYEAQCRHTLFDAGCNSSGNMNPATFAKNGTVGAGSTQATIIGVKLAAPPTNPGSGTYSLGRILMTSGYNNTFQRTVKSWDGNVTLSLLNPLPFAVMAGDTFQVFSGCDKLLTTCTEFQNQFSYGGFGFIPAPEVT